MHRSVPLMVLLVTAMAHAQAQRLTAVPFHKVEVTDRFWKQKMEANRKVTLEACLRKCEETGRFRNFAVAAGRIEGKHEGRRYNDSDVYKILEGAAYTLVGHRDPDLEKRIDRIIEDIEAAQGKDGYLNTYYTLVKPALRWKDIRSGHELYCAGHLMEAAVAWFQATGKRKLLDVAVRFADLIHREFGPGKRLDPPGHQEIELALVKLSRITGEGKYLELARFFLDQRGSTEGRKRFGKYCQDHKPVREQREVEGHAVRAMYQFSAMADVAACTGDEGLTADLDHLWHDVVDRKMYVTGGIGDSASNEGFTGPYVLPNDTAYAETCAAIGMALWNHRMFLMTGEGKYMDVVEREIYNGLISGVSTTGDRFFYPNRLGSRGGVHRVPWFSCSCCPSNIVRFVPAMGGRVFAHGPDTICVGLYMGAAADIPLEKGGVHVAQTTDYPWSGAVTLRVTPSAEPFSFTLKLRKPGWCESPVKVTVNGEAAEARETRGFLALERAWQKGDEVRVDIPLNVRRVHADPRVKSCQGRVALLRGPVVYCLEGVDHGGHVRNLVLPPYEKLEARFEKDFLGGMATITGKAVAVTVDDSDRRLAAPVRLQAVPYHVWANRDAGEMVVWIPESPALAEVPGQGAAAVNAGVRLLASHCYETDSLLALNDRRLPARSSDHGLPRMTWWPRRGTTEWVQYGFEKPRKLASADVYWFDDTGRGQCRAPASWRLLYREGKTWKPVRLEDGSRYPTRLDAFNAVKFEAVTTRAMRLEVTLRSDVSGGILEWRVK